MLKVLPVLTIWAILLLTAVTCAPAAPMAPPFDTPTPSPQWGITLWPTPASMSHPYAYLYSPSHRHIERDCHACAA